MCLAIFKPANVSINHAFLSNGWQRNPDGAGFAYIRKKKLVVERGLMTLKEFSAKFKEVEAKHINSPMVIHFRIRSMGDKTPDNTHPYRFEHGALIHNGTINGTGAVYGAGKSDTELFVEKFGKEFTFDTLNGIKDDINSALEYNKIAILYEDGRHMILNEGKGQWHDGVWYSNSTFMPNQYNK